jgi:hypothetical protein
VPTPATPPAVTTDNASNVTFSSARLNGTLTSLGTATSVNVSFQWGTSPSNLTSETTAQTVSANVTFYSNLGSLSANTTYYFQAKAVGRGTSYGINLKSFTTLPTTPPAPAKFIVSDVTVTPGTCKPDEEVTIAATVTNTGGTSGQYDVILTINGVKEGTKSVTLDPGTSLQVKFTVSKSIPDNYKVDVNGITASFVVEEPVALQESISTPTPSVTSAPTVLSATTVRWWIVGAVVGAAVLGGVIYGAVRRRRRA